MHLHTTNPTPQRLLCVCASPFPAKLYPMSLILLFILVILASGVRGEKPKSWTDPELETYLKRINKPAVKTIKSDDGGIIDCVNIYKQPAFDHPLLRNHTIQMRPNIAPEISVMKSSGLPIQQSWMKKGSCPEGTIPIRRILKSDLLRASSIEAFGKKNTSLLQSYGRIFAPGTGTQEGAGVVFANTAERWLGASAELNVWGVSAEPTDFSLTSVTVSSGNSPGSSLETGYAVHPRLYGDTQARFFTSWTADSDRSTGCFDLMCPGFVQVSNKIALGSPISPLSTYNGPQYSIMVSIYKDADKWWMSYQNESIGYWPMSIVKDLDVMKNAVWAGWVLNSRNGGQHTTTQMGSGHFPDEGVNRSAFIANALVLGPDSFVPPFSVIPFATKEGCYNVKSLGAVNGQGFTLFYGGPGGPNCG